MRVYVPTDGTSKVTYKFSEGFALATLLSARLLVSTTIGVATEFRLEIQNKSGRIMFTTSNQETTVDLTYVAMFANFGNSQFTSSPTFVGIPLPPVIVQESDNLIIDLTDANAVIDECSLQLV